MPCLSKARPVSSSTSTPPPAGSRAPPGTSWWAGKSSTSPLLNTAPQCNGNSTTRFRRYDGTDARPLRPEHDLSAPRFLLRPNHTYRIRLVARGGTAEYWCDGECIFTFRDPAPLASGWFALRTVKSHLEIRNLVIRQGGTGADK